MNNVIDRLTSQVTGLRSVVRDQAGEIRRLSSPPSLSILSAINRARQQSVSRKYNFIFEIVSIESTENKKQKYLRKYMRDDLSIWKASNDNMYSPIK
jgi:hypothetical protein